MPDLAAANTAERPGFTALVCPECGGDGWYVGHEDECHETGDCNCSGVQIQCECQYARSASVSVAANEQDKA